MGRKRFAKYFEELRGRWRDNPKLVMQILRDAANNKDWTKRIKKFLAEDSEKFMPPNGIYSYPPDLRHFILDKKNLHKIKIKNANLKGATGFRSYGAPIFISCDLSRSKWQRARLQGAKFINCDLSHASFSDADVSQVDFTKSSLQYASFRRANLEGASFRNSDLRHANLSNAKCNGTTFSDAYVFGISVWGLRGQPRDQSNLIITPDGNEMITIDNIKLGQFIYLLLNNKEIRDVIETITSKMVLILGRFSPERKIVLDYIREELRKFNLVPVLFDFDTPVTRDTIETIITLAGLAKLVIADLSDARSVMQELQAIVPSFPTLPIQPLIKVGEKIPGMFDHIQNLGPDRIWPIIYYESAETLINSIRDRILKSSSKSEKIFSQTST